MPQRNPSSANSRRRERAWWLSQPASEVFRGRPWRTWRHWNRERRRLNAASNFRRLVEYRSPAALLWRVSTTAGRSTYYVVAACAAHAELAYYRTDGINEDGRTDVLVVTRVAAWEVLEFRMDDGRGAVRMFARDWVVDTQRTGNLAGGAAAVIACSEW